MKTKWTGQNKNNKPFWTNSELKTKTINASHWKHFVLRFHFGLLHPYTLIHSIFFRGFVIVFNGSSTQIELQLIATNIMTFILEVITFQISIAVKCQKNLIEIKFCFTKSFRGKIFKTCDINMRRRGCRIWCKFWNIQRFVWLICYCEIKSGANFLHRTIQVLKLYRLQ